VLGGGGVLLGVDLLGGLRMSERWDDFCLWVYARPFYAAWLCLSWGVGGYATRLIVESLT